jgi:hypothetical protein
MSEETKVTRGGTMNRDELNEALALYDNHEPIDPDTLDVFVVAARWAASFPTDEQVEAAARAIHANDRGYAHVPWDHWVDSTRAAYRAQARAALEAVALDPKENDADR